ncbi:MAG: extracellular solute-binding protein [Clostridia bacterium]|nr:extracellular solute-binding protein [Clostridia bacterium]
MKSLRKTMALSVAAVMACSMLASCGGDGAVEPTQTSTNSDKPYEGVTLHYAVSESATQGGEVVDLVNLVKEKTGINIEFTIVPNTNAGEVDKALVSLMAGDELDILYGTDAKLKTYYNAGVLTSLDELAENTKYDMESVFGDSLVNYSDGHVYGLPAYKDIWLTFYNKKLFDEANVEYPSAEGWTWEKYVETAKKLTDSGKGVFGSFMLDYDNYNYMYALQNGWEPYNADQTESNFTDQKFKDSLKWFYGLGNDEKIQPDSVTYAAGTYPWNTFVASDKMAMFVCGGWVASMLPNTEKYPRDWQCGILPMPYPEGQEPSTLAVTGCYAVPTTSKNKEAAFAAIKCMAEEQYTLGYGRIPARVDLTDEEITSYIADKLVPTFANDGITTEDFRSAWFDADRKVLSEKIIGPADATISQIVIEEAQLYGSGSKDIDTAAEAVKKRSDAAIKEDNQ